MDDNRYQIGPMIGSGGMSEVFAAEDTVLGRKVAVKMLRPEMARDAGFRERFRREAQNSGRLNHPNIVAVFDTGDMERDGMATPYIVMELVHGRTLREIIREDGPLSPQEAAQILGPVADALQASHEAGIIHRDIKPANIMLTNTGQVKVMDFGIARALDDSTSAMTQTSAVIGTAQYLSPEQARGNSADARSDVYALGCVLYEAVTGRTPFEGETPFAVAYQHVQEDPVPPSQYLSDPALTPTERVNIDAVVLTAMAKHPADRYQSAWEMGQDLGRLARGQVTQAARVHVPAGETPAGGPATATTQVVGASAAGMVDPTRAPVESTRHAAQPRPAGSGGWMKALAIILAAVLALILGYFAWDMWINPDGRDDLSHSRANAVIVPEVENRPRGEVVKELESMGLLVTVNEEANPDIARDRAIRVNPTPGSQLQKNSSITLTVSSGKEITDVPDVTGMNLDEARKMLSDAGLVLSDKVSESNDDAPAGEVVSQDPAGGTQLSKGSKIRVTVSKGPATVTVPDVTGMDRDEAVATLEAQRFDVRVRVVDSPAPEGQVTAVSNRGEKIPEGEAVTVDVSNGMLITAPDLVGSTQSAAERALREAGWSGRLTVGPPVPTGALIDNGKIGWSSAVEGSLLRKDAPVEVRFWEFNASALLPSP